MLQSARGGDFDIQKTMGDRNGLQSHEIFRLQHRGTHMRDMGRIAGLVAMVCMALVWAYLIGGHKDINIKPIRILKHGRKAKSLVKYGLEEISTLLMRPAYNPKFDVFKFLSCT